MSDVIPPIQIGVRTDRTNDGGPASRSDVVSSDALRAKADALLEKSRSLRARSEAARAAAQSTRDRVVLHAYEALLLERRTLELLAFASRRALRS